MRQIINNDLSSGYTTITEITLSSTTGVNKERYINMPQDDAESTSTLQNDNNTATQSELLSGIVKNINQLTQIIDSIKPQGESNLTDMTIDVAINNISFERQFVSVNSDSQINFKNSLLKSIKLDIENSFPVGTRFTLFFNNTILAKINIRDTSIKTYELNLNKYLKYDDSEMNNMNIEICTNLSNSDSEDWIPPTAILHLNMAMEIDEI